VAQDGDRAAPPLREPLAMALVNKGVRLGALERFEGALGVYDDIVARYDDVPEPALREAVARASRRVKRYHQPMPRHYINVLVHISRA